MDKFLDKLSSYNLLNYLFPGAIFVVFATLITNYSFTQKNIVIEFFLYYFIGLVISRIGSLFIEPALKKWSFLNFAEYPKFLEAARKDPKLDILSEINNVYRTLCALFLSVMFLKVYELLESEYPFLYGWTPYLLIVFLLFLFFYSYKKQTNYIRKRVDQTT